jgi:PAS domain-containing protein
MVRSIGPFRGTSLPWLAGGLLWSDQPFGKLNEISDAPRLQLLIEAIRDYAIIMIDMDGTVASWNSGAARLTGYRRGRLLGSPHPVLYRSGTNRANSGKGAGNRSGNRQLQRGRMARPQRW